MNKTLTKRKDCEGGNHYYYVDSKDRKWSIVDIKRLMSTAPFGEDKCFAYWEAILMEGEELNSDVILREKTSEELFNKIESHE